MASMQRFILALLVALSTVSTDAKLRGPSISNELKEKLRNPRIREDFRGRTLQDLGVKLLPESELIDAGNNEGRLLKTSDSKSSKSGSDGAQRVVRFFSVSTPQMKFRL